MTCQSTALALSFMMLTGTVLADGGGTHCAGPPAAAADTGHAGKVVSVGGNRFEVVFGDAGIRVFPRDADGDSLALAAVTGEVVLETRRGAPVTLPLDVSDLDSGAPSMLSLERDFSGAADGSHRASFTLQGLPDGEVRFSTVLRRVQTADLQAMIAAYPLSTCVVSGEKLGEHGKIIDHVHQGRLVRFCCPACVKDFNKDPQAFLAKLASAAAEPPAPEPQSHEGHDMPPGSGSSHGQGQHSH